VTIFEKLANSLAAKKQTAASDFQGLVVELAQGKEPKPERVEDVLARSGKSLDDLRVAVEKKQHRHALRARIEAVPKHQKEMAQLERQIAVEDEKFNQARDAHVEVTLPLRQRHETLSEAIKAGEQARQQLIDSADDADLQAEIWEQQERINHLTRYGNQLREQVRQLHQGREKLAQAERTLDRKLAKQIREEGEQLVAAGGTAEQELAGVTKDIEAAQTRMNELRERLLVS
jgi:DNA repair exonuclease SbcCD ATPase subunit